MVRQARGHPSQLKPGTEPSGVDIMLLLAMSMIKGGDTNHTTGSVHRARPSHSAPTWPLARPSKPSCTTYTVWPWEMPVRTAERTAAFMPAAGAPTFRMAREKLVFGEEGETCVRHRPHRKWQEHRSCASLATVSRWAQRMPILIPEAPGEGHRDTVHTGTHSWVPSKVSRDSVRAGLEGGIVGAATAKPSEPPVPEKAAEWGLFNASHEEQWGRAKRQE